VGRYLRRGWLMTQELKDLIHAKADAVQRQYHRHGRVFRAASLVAAFLVIAAGLVMLVVPGPAIIVIPVGIAMLAARFRWAQWLLRETVERGVAFQRWLSKAGLGMRLATGLAGATVAAGLTFLMLQ
jgi:Putative transmembrane protein (PGPGW)